MESFPNKQTVHWISAILLPPDHPFRLRSLHEPHSMKALRLVWLALAASLPASADDWPQFRGPGHQGVSAETRLPLHWSASSNVLWKAAVPGEGWSSPIVWGDRVYLTTATDNGQTCRVLALDANTGQTVWNKAVFEQVPKRKETRNSYATPTPATDGRRIYACFGDGSFAALEADGSLAWTNRAHPFYSQHGLGTSLVLHDGILLMARDGSSDGEDKKVGWQTAWDQAALLALDARTGATRWVARRGLSRISHGAPNLWVRDGQTLVVSEAGDVLQGHDLRTGDRVFTSKVAGEGKVPSVVLGDGLAFTSGGWGGRMSIKAFRLGGTGDLGESNLVWEQKKGMPSVPSMLYLPPHLYAVTDGGIATCYDGATGNIVWQERVGGAFSASPVAAAGRLYLTSDAGETVVLAAGPKFEILARNPLEESLQASAAIAHGRFYIRTGKNLFCIGHPR